MEDHKVHNKILIGLAIITAFLGFSLKTCSEQVPSPKTYTKYNAEVYTSLYKLCLDSKRSGQSECASSAREAATEKVCLVGDAKCEDFDLSGAEPK